MCDLVHVCVNEQHACYMHNGISTFKVCFRLFLASCSAIKARKNRDSRNLEGVGENSLTKQQNKRRLSDCEGRLFGFAFRTWLITCVASASSYKINLLILLFCSYPERLISDRNKRKKYLNSLSHQIYPAKKFCTSGCSGKFCLDREWLH